MSLFVERRRPAVTPELLMRVTLAWAMIAALLLVTGLPSILGHRFPDPDDTLRLLQVRDLIAGQGWYDTAVHRADGEVMHWSRLVDLPIAAVILALRGLVGVAAAETTALVVVPLVTMFVCLFLVGRIAWRLLGDELAMFACLALAFSVPVVEQLRPMRIDHHGWQIALVLVALNGMMARSPRIGGWIVGGALATALSISIEQLPIACAFVAVLAFRWLADRHQRQWLVSAMQALAVVSAVLFAATRGLSAAQTCDQIAPVHLAVFGWGAAVFTATSALEPRPRGMLFAAVAAAVGGALAIVSQFAPACMGGTFGAVEPVARELWLSRVAEGSPIWRQDLPVMLQIVLPPAIGLAALVRLAGRSSGWLRRCWTEYVILLAAAFVLSIFVARAGAVAGALAAIPVGWQLREWLRRVRHARRPMKRIATYGAVSVALVPAAPALLLLSAVPGQAQGQYAPLHRMPTEGECGISAAPLALKDEPPGRSLVPLDVGAIVLLDTRQSVMATAHHRAAKLGTVIRAFTADDAAARAIVEREGIDTVALCPSLAEPQNYAHDAPNGLAAALIGGRAPGWLEPLAPRGDGWMVWRVRH